MSTTKTLDQQIADLKAENEQKLTRKIKELGIKEQLLQATGLDFMVLIHSEKSISIWVENNQYNNYSKFDRFKLADYYKELCNIFTPINAPVRVSGGQYENFAPAKIDFINHFSEITYYHQQSAKITFTFEGGINVSFKFPSAPEFKNFNSDIITYKYAELKPRNKNTMPKKCYYVPGFGKVNLYGNDFYCYAANENQVNEFMNVVFFGKINY